MESYRTVGTCARQILFSVKDNILTDLKFLGGCAGGLQALSKLLIGKDIDFIIEKCRGILCKNNTSCPDQLACALCLYKKRCEEFENTKDQIKQRGHPIVLETH